MKSGRGESGMVSHVISCLEIHPVNAKHPNVKIIKYNLSMLNFVIVRSVLVTVV